MKAVDQLAQAVTVAVLTNGVIALYLLALLCPSTDGLAWANSVVQ
jgi:hypothetical protein